MASRLRRRFSPWQRAEQLRAFTTAQPFRPFIIKMASGEQFTIQASRKRGVRTNGAETWSCSATECVWRRCSWSRSSSRSNVAGRAGRQRGLMPLRSAQLAGPPDSSAADRGPRALQNWGGRRGRKIPPGEPGQGIVPIIPTPRRRPSRSRATRRFKPNSLALLFKRPVQLRLAVPLANRWLVRLQASLRANRWTKKRRISHAE